LMEAEAEYPDQRLVHRTYFPVYRNMDPMMQEDFIVACTRSRKIPHWHLHLLLGE